MSSKQEDVLRRSQELQTALVGNDRQTLRALLSDTFVIIGLLGAGRLGKKTLVEMLKRGIFKCREFTLERPAVVINGETATVTGDVVRTIEIRGVQTKRASTVMSTWKLEGGGDNWKLQATHM